MRIVHYKKVLLLEQGGVVRALLDLCTTMAGRGHEVHLMNCDPADVPEAWRDGEPGAPRSHKLERIGGRLPRLSGRGLATARQAIEGADVLHLHGAWDPMCIQLAKLARGLGVPHVITLHGMLDDWCMTQRGIKKRLYLAALGRRFLNNADAVHCTARAELDQSKKWFPKGRTVIVPYIVDLSPYVTLPGPELARDRFGDVFSDNGRAVVLYLSRLHEKKGLERLVHAADILRRRGRDLTFAIAGTGEPDYEQQLRRLVDEVGIGDRLHFLGFVGGETKVSLYEAADLFVLPTSQENWGLVLTESMACGTPIVTTRGVDIWQELQSSGAALIVDQTPEATADAIDGMLADDETRREMRQKARAWVLDNLDGQNVARQYEELYERIKSKVESRKSKIKS